MRSLTFYLLTFFGFGESRLNDNYIDNDEIPIPGYFAEHRDSSLYHHSGLYVYIKGEIQYLRRKDLEPIKWKVSRLSFSCQFVQYLLVLFIYPKDTVS